MKNTTQQSSSSTITEQQAVVREHFSIKDFNYEFDLFTFISQCATIRKLQKKYYSTQDKEVRRSLLLDCKREEASLDKLGNYLWKKYNLNLISQSKFYRIG